jgi:hypothetical protein
MGLQNDGARDERSRELAKELVGSALCTAP